MNKLIESLQFSGNLYVNALIVLAAFIIIAIIADLFVVKILKRLTKLTASDFDDKIIAILHKPMFFTIILGGFLSSLDGLEIEPGILSVIRKVVFTLMALMWTLAISRSIAVVILSIFNKFSDLTGLSKDIYPLVTNVAKIILMIAGLMVILAIWKVDITPLMASAGIVSVVVAMAAKDTIANFFGGISVFMDKPYKLGDYIELDQKERGEVVDIGIRSTRIKTRDDILISIPNALIANSKIVNESQPVQQFRVRIPIGVAYGSDIELVEKTLLKVADENTNIILDPEPRVRFRTFGDSSLDFELLCWAKEPAIRGKTIHEMNKSIYHKFNEKGIAIPFPQRDLHIYGNNMQ